MRRGVWLIGAVLLGGSAAQAAENPLARYRWTARVLVISAPEPGDPSLGAQRTILDKVGADLKERHLVTLEAVGATPKARALRAALGLPGDAFRVVLVGKDGEAKRVETAPLAAGALFETIDAMPMRRGEARR